MCLKIVSVGCVVLAVASLLRQGLPLTRQIWFSVLAICITCRRMLLSFFVLRAREKLFGQRFIVQSGN